MDTLIVAATALAGIAFSLGLLGLGLWLGFRRFRSLLQFNIQGANPMVRLVPNVSYGLLFLMLLVSSL